MSIGSELAAAVQAVTKDFAKIGRQRIRDARAADRAYERMLRAQSFERSIKSIAWAHMAEVYAGVSGGELPAHARQLFYAMRPIVLAELPNKQFRDVYFTQNLLPAFVQENPELTAEWDVVYDDRGHFIEPHTDRTIGLGTLSVREYLRSCKSGLDDLPDECETMDLEIRTHGPINRFANVLFIEKEGFFPLLESAQIAERFDLALMSSKGMSNTSARTLIEGLAGVRFLVLHDFDKYGFAIAGTLRTDTWRYQFSRPVEVVDIGLRLGDVKAEKLDGEPMQVPESSAINLRRHGATEEEIAYLTDKGSGRGQRVELNAMTSPQFVQFLERKLKKHGVKKLIPDETALAEAYRRIWVSERVKSDLDAIYQIALKEAETLMIPKNLIARIKAEFGKRLTLSWDAALKAIVQEDDLEAGT